MKNERYVLYPFGQSTIALDKTLHHTANVSLPITDSIRENIETNFTLFNPSKSRNFNSFIHFYFRFLVLGKAKLVYAESVNSNQTRFYLTVRSNSFFLNFINHIFVFAIKF